MKQLYACLPPLTLLALSLGGAQSATAQHVFTDNTLAPYQQNFDAMSGDIPFAYGTMANPALLGVYAEVQADPMFGNGSLFPWKARENDGSIVAGNYYHFGKPGETDRAFGGVAEAYLGFTGNGYVGIRLKNGSSATIENLEIEYAMEQWYNSGNDQAAYVNVSYRKSTEAVGENMGLLSTGIAGAPWTPVPELTVAAPSTGTVIQSRDGNSPANRRVAHTTLTDINLAPGQEIMIRWSYVLNTSTNGNGVSIDDVVITPQTNVFFAQGSPIGASARSSQAQAASTTLEWRNKAGVAPTSLSAANQTYYVTGAVSATALGSITGDNSKIIVGVPAPKGSASQPGLLVLADATPLEVPVEVTEGSTLRIEEGAANVPLQLDVLAPTSTVVYAGTAATQTILPASYGKLALEGAGAKVLGGNVLVNGGLQLAGAKLNLNTYDATITKGSSVQGADASSYVVTSNGGHLRQSVLSDNVEVLFPVGTAAAYLPVTLRQSAYRAEDVFSVQATGDKYRSYGANDAGTGAPVELPESVRPTWLVSEEVKGNANVSLKMQWNEADQTSDFDPAKAFVSHFVNGYWDRTATEVGAVPAAAGTYTISRSNITSFSPFTVSSDRNQPLPVELVSFTAKRAGGVVVCEWATASEKNNDHFELQRSLDGKNFTALRTIKGAGTSTLGHSYTAQDLQPAQGTAYYRLQQADTDGKVTYSSVVAVAGGSSREVATRATVVPNPGTGRFELLTELAAPGVVRGEVFNMVGLRGATLEQAQLVGTNRLPLDLSQQPAGVYIVRLSTPQGPLTLRLIKQ
jgi:hypothetical protein